MKMMRNLKQPTTKKKYLKKKNSQMSNHDEARKREYQELAQHDDLMCQLSPRQLRYWNSMSWMEDEEEAH